jgi:hypothetical protein
MERADDQPKGKTFDRIPAVVSAAEPSGFRGAVVRLESPSRTAQSSACTARICSFVAISSTFTMFAPSRDAPERRCESTCTRA